jgi:hypothetical protein
MGIFGRFGVFMKVLGFGAIAASTIGLKNKPFNPPFASCWDIRAESIET